MPADSEAGQRSGTPAAEAEVPRRTLAGSAYSDDDGRAEPGLRQAMVAGISLDRLATSRLLVAVTAVVAECEDGDPGGHVSTGKSSHMAVVSMVNEAGQRGLLAFTGLDALYAWDVDARPVPVLGAQAARAAVEDGASALVVDVAGPHRLVVQGDALLALAALLGDEFSTPVSGW